MYSRQEDSILFIIMAIKGNSCLYKIQKLLFDFYYKMSIAEKGRVLLLK